MRTGAVSESVADVVVADHQHKHQNQSALCRCHAIPSSLFAVRWKLGHPTLCQ
jgi:hypothetical protein